MGDGSYSVRRGGSSPGGHLHARARRLGPAVPPLADGGELRAAPAAAPASRTGPARRRLRPRHHHRRPRRPGRPGPDARGRRLARPPRRGPWPGRAAGRAGGGRRRRPGGVVAVRDVDYATFTWFPADEGLDRWLDLYHRVARHNDAEPDAGRRLLAWAHAAGLRDVTATASAWCYASAAEREWWGNSWAGRATASSFAEQALTYGLAGPAELEEVSAAWLRWAASDDGWLGMVHGELLIRV